MSIKFSEKNQAFYDLVLDYGDLPDDLVDINKDLHMDLLAAINAGHYISSELKISKETRKSIFEKWNGEAWVDPRNSEEIKAAEFRKLTPLTRRQFRMAFILNGYDLDAIKAKILEIEDIQTRQLTLVEWEDAVTFERDNASLVMMAGLLGLDDDQVNAMWKQALTL
jgi:hypothetical protein